MFPVENRKVTTTIECCKFGLVLVPNFSLNWSFWLFWPNLPKNGVSSLKQKIEHHHWILDIPISLGAKFQLNVTISILWTKFDQKECSQSKVEKVNITIFLVPNFNLIWQFRFFRQNLAKKGVSSQNQKHHYWILHI